MQAKSVCQKGALPPLDSPVISVSRIQNRPCRFYILTPEIKEAPSPSSKGMLTVLLYNYPKVAFLQYCVSVGCGVVSLTKGTSIFPLCNGNSGYKNLFCYFLLRQPGIFSVLFQSCTNLHRHNLLTPASLLQNSSNYNKMAFTNHKVTCKKCFTILQANDKNKFHLIYYNIFF